MTGIRTCFMIKRVCDGGQLRAHHEARSAVGVLPTSDP